MDRSDLIARVESAIQAEIKKVEAARAASDQRSDTMLFFSGRQLGLFDAWVLLRALSKEGEQP